MQFNPTDVSQFLGLFKEIYPIISTFDGCKKLSLLKDKDRDNVFFTYSHWVDENALNVYRNSELFAGIWKQTKSYFEAKAEAWSVEEVVV
jgi:quinol monooxygenase YgiN